MSLERIVATAIELLDAQGLEGLTMRGLADRLGSGVMSLYWHIDNKDDVLDLALDEVLAYQPMRAGSAEDWRGDIVHLLEDWRAGMLRHPWSAVLLPRRTLGRSVLDRLERLSQALAHAGLADAHRNAAIWSLWNHLMGATITRASFGVSDGDRAAAQGRIEEMARRYPALSRSRLLLDNDWDGAFRQGLNYLLDGLVQHRP